MANKTGFGLRLTATLRKNLKSKRRTLALLILGTAIAAGLAGCSQAVDRIMYGDPDANARTANFQSRVSHVVVTQADISQPYRILGPVSWPDDAAEVRFLGPGLWGYGGYICEPQKVAAAAVARYGSQADAVIGVMKTKPGHQQEQCDGTAVSFVSR